MSEQLGHFSSRVFMGCMDDIRVWISKSLDNFHLVDHRVGYHQTPFRLELAGGHLIAEALHLDPS